MLTTEKSAPTITARRGSDAEGRVRDTVLQHASARSSATQHSPQFRLRRTTRCPARRHPIGDRVGNRPLLANSGRRNSLSTQNKVPIHPKITIRSSVMGNAAPGSSGEGLSGIVWRPPGGGPEEGEIPEAAICPSSTGIKVVAYAGVLPRSCCYRSSISCSLASSISTTRSTSGRTNQEVHAESCCQPDPDDDRRRLAEHKEIREVLVLREGHRVVRDREGPRLQRGRVGLGWLGELPVVSPFEGLDRARDVEMDERVVLLGETGMQRLKIAANRPLLDRLASASATRLCIELDDLRPERVP